MIARILGTTAGFEGEHKAERQRRKHRELAEAGKPTGGGDRAFGFEPDRITIRPDEAREIRDAVSNILVGASLRGVVMDWNARGVRTPGGGTWSRTSAKRTLTSARIAGLRSHRGVVVGPAVWEAIITPEQHEGVVAILKTRTRRASRRYLLTGGLARCARCGAAMVARPNARGARRYVCTKDEGGCNRTFHIADTLEGYVRDHVFVALDSAALARLRADTDDDDGLGAELAALETRRAEAVAAYGSGALSLESFQAADRDLEDRIARAREQMAARSNAALAAVIPSNAEALAKWWTEADLERRRQLVALVVERVEVGPAVPGRNQFDAKRVSIRWRV